MLLQRLGRCGDEDVEWREEAKRQLGAAAAAAPGLRSNLSASLAAAAAAAAWQTLISSSQKITSPSLYTAGDVI